MKNVPPWPYLFTCVKKNIIIIMRVCLHSSGKAFTYRRGCSCKVKKKKDRQVRWLQNAILTTNLKLENDGLCGVQGRAPRLDISKEIENQGHVIRSSLEMHSMNLRWSCESNGSVPHRIKPFVWLPNPKAIVLRNRRTILTKAYICKATVCK